MPGITRSARRGFARERKPLALPGGARLAVWVIVNIEEWDIQKAMPRAIGRTLRGAELWRKFVGVSQTIETGQFPVPGARVQVN